MEHDALHRSPPDLANAANLNQVTPRFAHDPQLAIENALQTDVEHELFGSPSSSPHYTLSSRLGYEGRSIGESMEVDQGNQVPNSKLHAVPRADTHAHAHANGVQGGEGEEGFMYDARAESEGQESEGGAAFMFDAGAESEGHESEGEAASMFGSGDDAYVPGGAQAVDEDEEEQLPQVPRRRPGRPRKHPIVKKLSADEQAAEIANLKRQIEALEEEHGPIFPLAVSDGPPSKRRKIGGRKKGGRKAKGKAGLKKDAEQEIPFVDVGHDLYARFVAAGKQVPEDGCGMLPAPTTEEADANAVEDTSAPNTAPNPAPQLPDNDLTSLTPSRRAVTPHRNNTAMLYEANSLTYVAWTLYNAGKVDEAIVMGQFAVDTYGMTLWRERLAYYSCSESGSAAQELGVAKQVLADAVGRLEVFDAKQAGYLECLGDQIDFEVPNAE